jgi:hypothetical protein
LLREFVKLAMKQEEHGEAIAAGEIPADAEQHPLPAIPYVSFPC